MDLPRIIGRSSSHYTRTTRIFAQELGVAVELVPVFDVTAVDPTVFADNPALKIPTLRRAGSQVFGSENICRALAEMAGGRARIVWPEELRGDLSCNAQEMVAHAMAAQVQLVIGTIISKLPADNIYFVKIRKGFDGALAFLNANLEAALAALPSPRDLSLFEVQLFCLVEHLGFRQTLPLEPYPALVRFAEGFGKRRSAELTGYRLDTPSV